MSDDLSDRLSTCPACGRPINVEEGFDLQTLIDDMFRTVAVHKGCDLFRPPTHDDLLGDIKRLAMKHQKEK